MKRYGIVAFILIFILAGCTSTTKKDRQEYHVIKGMNLAQEGDYTQALKELKIAYKKDRKNPIVLKQIAYIYSSFQDYENAKKYYLEILDIDETDPFAISNLAILYYKNGEYETSLEQIRSLAPDSVDAKIKKLKAFNYYKMGDYNKALNYFENMLATDDYVDAEFTQYYLDALKKVGKSNAGYMYLYEIYNKYKRSLDLVLLYSDYVYTEFNDVDSAIDALEKYILNVQRSERAFFQLAKYYKQAEDYKKSKLYLNLLSDRYKYDLNVLQLKLEVAEKLGEKENIEKIKKEISNIKRQEK